MARNFEVTLVNRIGLISEEEDGRVVLATQQTALGLVSSLLNKGMGGVVQYTSAPVTHKTSAAALSFLEVGQMNLFSATN